MPTGITRDDSFHGDDSSETFLGDSGDDGIHGGGGNDRLYGDGYGNDSVGKDNLYGDGGNDELYGGAGADKLYGGTGNDLLKGDNGADRLYGGEGSDILVGGNGDDVLFGYKSNGELSQVQVGDADFFVFDKTDGNDKVYDFGLGDTVVLTGGEGYAIAYKGANSILTYGETTVVFYDHHLDAEDILFGSLGALIDAIL